MAPDDSSERPPQPALAPRRIHYEGLVYAIARQRPAIGDLAAYRRHAAERRGRSRYGMRGESTWYAALDPQTAIVEAGYHHLRDARGRERPLLGALHCLRVSGHFGDLHGRERERPDLIGEDYTVTRMLGRAWRRSPQLSGLLYPSARCQGSCLAIFRADVLLAVSRLGPVPVRRIGPDEIEVLVPGETGWRRLHRAALRREA